MQDRAQTTSISATDDQTVVIGSGSAKCEPGDHTLVVSTAHALLGPSQVPNDSDPTHAAFLRRVRERAEARSRSAPVIVEGLVADSTSDKRKRAFFSPIITRVVSRNILSQKDAISASLRARDQGITFLTALAQISGLSGDQALYKAIADEAQLLFIGNDRELVQAIQEVEWLSCKEAEQRGVLLLQPTSEGTPQYAALDPFDVLQRDWISTRVDSLARPVVVLPNAFHSALTTLKTRIEAPAGTDQTLVPIDVSWQQEK